MKPKLLATVFAAALLFSCLTFPVKAQTEPFSFRLPSFELYAPAKIIISFSYTNNVTINVRTLGTSLYKATTSPVQAIFETDAFDVYTITFDIYYSMPVAQPITIGLYEGGRSAKGIEFDVNTDHINIQMKVSVIEAPRYPTAEEIADSMWKMLQGSLNEFTTAQQNLIAKMSDTVLVTGSLAVIGFVVSLAVLIAVFHVHRKVAELSEWGIRHETEHRRRVET